MLFRSVVAACLTSFLTVSSASAVDQTKVDESIKRGVDWLWSQQTEDGYWSYGGESDDKALGMTALAALALNQSGVLPSDPRLQSALSYVRKQSLDCKDTYSVSLSILLLSRVGQVEDRPLIRSLSAKLVAAQTLAGGWDATCPVLTPDQVRDTALRKQQTEGLGQQVITQLAVLALWQAQDAGANVGDAFRRVRHRMAFSQTKTGGWNYNSVGDLLGDGPSETTAGAFVWIVSSAWEIRNARKQGLTTLEAKPPRPASESTTREMYKDLKNPISAKDTKKKKGKGKDTETASSQPKDQAEIEKELRGVKEKSRPVDIYDALQRSSVQMKLAINAWYRGSGESGGNIWPLPHAKYSRKSQEDRVLKPVDEEGQLFYTYPNRMPPPLDVTRAAPLANDEVLKKALARVEQLTPASLGATPYHMWCLQRLAVLLGKQKFGAIDWYEVGATNLLKKQLADGSWGIPQKEDGESEYDNGPDTCYALLFLNKARLGSEAQRMVVPPSEKPFRIERDEKLVFATFAEAIAAAAADDVIVVEGDGPFPVGGVVIDKKLTIRPKPGYNPVFVYTRPTDKYGLALDLKQHPNMQNLLVIKAPITVEGIHFRMDPPSGIEADWTVLNCQAEALFMLNCTLSESSAKSTVGLNLVDSRRVLLRNTMFVGFQPSIRVQSEKGVNLFLKDCVVYGPSMAKVSGAGDFNCWLVESTTRVTNGFDLGELKGAASFVVEHSALAAQQLIAKLGSGPREWLGQRNLYDVQVWIVGAPTEVTDVRQWTQYWKNDEQRSVHGMAPFQVYSIQMGPYRHELSPQQWAMDTEKLVVAMPSSASHQIGANVYVVGAGREYTLFCDQEDYDSWQKVTVPSDRTE